MKRIKGVLLAALLTVTVSMPVYADRSEKVELPQSSTDYYMTVDSGEDGVDIYPSTDKKSGKFNGLNNERLECLGKNIKFYPAC